jgi:hypothetical protein
MDWDGSLVSDCLACIQQGLISRGYSYTLQKNNGDTWELTDSTGNKLTAPAVCFIIPPTDPEALALADRYKNKGNSMDLTPPTASQSFLFTALGILAQLGGPNIHHLHPLGSLRGRAIGPDLLNWVFSQGPGPVSTLS